MRSRPMRASSAAVVVSTVVLARPVDTTERTATDTNHQQQLHFSLEVRQESS